MDEKTKLFVNGFSFLYCFATPGAVRRLFADLIHGAGAKLPAGLDLVSWVCTTVFSGGSKAYTPTLEVSGTNRPKAYVPTQEI